MLPAFLELDIHEVHIEMANREFAEIELLAKFAKECAWRQASLMSKIIISRP